MSITVTGSITGGTVYNDGFYLDVHVLTGAKAATLQPGAVFVTTSSTSSGGSASITTTTAAAWVYGAYADPNFSDPGNAAVSGSTLIGNGYQTGSIDLCSFTLTSPVTTPGATTVGVTDTAAGAIALVEILPDGTIAESGSPSPSWAWTGDGSSVNSEMSAAFTPPPGSLIVALAASDGAADTVHTVSDSSGLIWTKIADATSVNGMAVTVWVADVPAYEKVNLESAWPGYPTPGGFSPGRLVHYSTGNQYTETLAGQLAVSGVAIRDAGKVNTTSAAVGGGLARALTRMLATATAVAVRLTRRVRGTLTTIVTVVASMMPQRLREVVFSGLTATAAAVTRQSGKLTIGVAAMGGTASRFTSRLLAASTAVAVVTVRRFGKAALTTVVVSPTLTFISAVTYFITAAAQLISSGAIRGAGFRMLTAQLTVLPVTAQVTAKTMTVKTIAAATATRNISRSLMMTVISVVSLNAIKVHLLAVQAVTAVNSVMVRRVLPSMVTTAILGGVAIRVAGRAIQGNFSAAGQTLRTAGREIKGIVTSTGAFSFSRMHMMAVNALIPVGVFTTRAARITTAAFTVASGVVTRLARKTLILPLVVLAAVIPGRPHLISLVVTASASGGVVVRHVFSAFVTVFKAGVVFANWVAGQARRNWRIP